MKMETKDISDLSLASYLSVAGHKLTGLNQSGRKILFSFDESPSLEADILKFYNRTAKVDPLTYSEVLRNFKSLTKSREGSFYDG